MTTRWILSGAMVGMWLVAGPSQAGLFDKLTDDIQRAFNGEKLEAPTHPGDEPSEPAATPATSVIPPAEVAAKSVGPSAKIKQTANLRDGPGTTHPKVGRVVAGQTVTILEEQDNWVKIQVSEDAGARGAWIYAPLVERDIGTAKKVAVTTSSGAATKTSGANTTPADPNALKSEYAGYSAEVRPIKEMMRKGEFDQVESFFNESEAKVRAKAKKEDDLVNDIGNLRWMERGTLAIDRGRFDEAERSFSYAERLLDEEKKSSYMDSMLGTGVSEVGAFITGNQELVPYSADGYENVLMLNYKSLAYLLEGRREAYNVARRAIDWQNREKARFEAELRTAREKLAQEESKQPDGAQSETTSGGSPGFLGAEQAMGTKYHEYDEIANRVPSAYVNPFGYYVAGMVQEYESSEDTSLRDNARISYEKALELNPESKVLQQALKEIKQAPPRNTRLVQVVAGTGFVPEKKLLSYYVPFQSGVIGIKLPIVVPEENTVARIEVRTAAGKKLATLSPIADVEAIALRHQKDMEPFRNLRIAMSVASSIATKAVLDNAGVLGVIGNVFREKMAIPDMRSWMTLPAELSAARLHLPKTVKQLKLVSYANSGKRLATHVVDVGSNSNNFVYVRAMDTQLVAYSPDTLWTVANR